MTYRVIVLPDAERELCEAALWWSENRDADQAKRWLVGFEQAIASLNENPERFGLAQEANLFPYEIRDLPYGLGSRPTHRAVFEIRGDAVLVHTVRHVSQQPLTRADLQ